MENLSSQTQRTLLSASAQLRLGKRGDVSTRDFMNGFGETDQMDSSFATRKKKKTKKPKKKNKKTHTNGTEI